MFFLKKEGVLFVTIYYLIKTYLYHDINHKYTRIKSLILFEIKDGIILYVEHRFLLKILNTEL